MTFPKHSLRTFWQKKVAGLGQVRSPKAVCWPHLRKVCNHARARLFDWSISSLQVLVRILVCAFCISQNFYISDLRLCQTRDLFTLQTYGKILKCLLLRVNESKPPNSFSIIGTGKGHLRSCNVINCFFLINRDIMILKTCKWYQTARLVKARRLVCSMTIPHNLVGEWPDLDLGSNFKLTCEYQRILISHRLDESNQKCIYFMSLCFLFQ